MTSGLKQPRATSFVGDMWCVRVGRGWWIFPPWLSGHWLCFQCIFKHCDGLDWENTDWRAVKINEGFYGKHKTEEVLVVTRMCSYRCPGKYGTSLYCVICSFHFLTTSLSFFFSRFRKMSLLSLTTKSCLTSTIRSVRGCKCEDVNVCGWLSPSYFDTISFFHLVFLSLPFPAFVSVLVLFTSLIQNLIHFSVSFSLKSCKASWIPWPNGWWSLCNPTHAHTNTHTYTHTKWCRLLDIKTHFAQNFFLFSSI